jgi:RND family efflux transporter MFP subunit
MKSPAARAAAGLLTLGTLLLAACGGDTEAAPQQRGGPGGGPGGMRGMRGGPTVVETSAAETGTLGREVNVSGIVEPIRSVGVNSQLAGALLSLGIEEGSRVERGQVLARLDDRELAAQVASAEASYNVAKAAYERAETLRKSQVITAAEYERDRAAFAAAEAQLAQLRTRHGYATIRAPISGVVTQKAVEAGDVVGQQTRLFTIGDVSTMVVRVPVSELDVVQLAPGAEANVMLDAFPGRTFNGTIRRVFPSADPQTRLVPVEVALTGESARTARPGFLARVTFSLGDKQDVLLVPASAVVGGNGSSAVFVVENGTATRRTVEIGLTSQGRVEILGGLQPGEAVVVTGNNALRDGSEVRVVSGPGAAPPPAAAPESSAAAPGAGRTS